MKHGFCEKGFMAYLEYQFPGVFSNYFTRELVENLIEHANDHENVSLDQFCYYLSDILPEVEFCEVAAFMDDGLLTKHGQEIKRETDIQVECDADGNPLLVIVDGKELYL